MSYILNINLYGTKLVYEKFIDLLDEVNSCIVNFGSSSSPIHVGSCIIDDKKIICSIKNITLEYNEKNAREELNSLDAYVLSKALVTCYTGLFSKEQPSLMVI